MKSTIFLILTHGFVHMRFSVMDTLSPTMDCYCVDNDQSFLSDDSNSKVLGNGDDLLMDDKTDNTSSVLRKEIEGKIAISKPKGSTSLVEGKDSLGESFVDAKKELLSTTSLGTHHKDATLICPTIDDKQAMEVERNFPNRKRKTTENDGNNTNPKLAR